MTLVIEIDDPPEADMPTLVVVLESDIDEALVIRVQEQFAAVASRHLVCRVAAHEVIIGEGGPLLAEHVRSLPGVAAALLPGDGAPLARRDLVSGRTVVDLGNGVRIGDGSLTVIAGPCAVETTAGLRAIALGVRARGAAALRGGAYKPRTSPYSFQGLGDAGLHLLQNVSRETGLPVVTEAVDVASVPQVARYAHMLQVGTRNAQNFALLRAVGATGRPVLLKRGFGCTIDEWLQAAEYVLRQGNGSVVLCERGIRSYEPSTRFTLDLSAVPMVKHLSHLPVVVDPSHGTGLRNLVTPMALAAAAAGADGLLLDVHHDARTARCDAKQAITLEEFGALMNQLSRVMPALGRSLARREPAIAVRVAADQQHRERVSV